MKKLFFLSILASSLPLAAVVTVNNTALKPINVYIQDSSARIPVRYSFFTIVPGTTQQLTYKKSSDKLVIIFPDGTSSGMIPSYVTNIVIDRDYAHDAKYIWRWQQ